MMAGEKKEEGEGEGEGLLGVGSVADGLARRLR
jgi:hypothetical protein